MKDNDSLYQVKVEIKENNTVVGLSDYQVYQLADDLAKRLDKSRDYFYNRIHLWLKDQSFEKPTIKIPVGLTEAQIEKLSALLIVNQNFPTKREYFDLISEWCKSQQFESAQEKVVSVGLSSEKIERLAKYIDSVHVVDAVDYWFDLLSSWFNSQTFGSIEEKNERLAKFIVENKGADYDFWIEKLTDWSNSQTFEIPSNLTNPHDGDSITHEIDENTVLSDEAVNTIFEEFAKLGNMKDSMVSIKPSWKDAPEWANWLTMNGDGSWTWFEGTPVVSMPDSKFIHRWDHESRREQTIESSSICNTDNWTISIEQRPRENNKPSWKDAPHWAKYLVSDENGTWLWLDCDGYLRTKFDKTGAKQILNDRPISKSTNELINFDDAPIWARWCAMDADGEWFWYQTKPTVGHKTWDSSNKCEKFEEDHFAWDVWKSTLIENEQFDIKRTVEVGQIYIFNSMKFKVVEADLSNVKCLNVDGFTWSGSLDTFLEQFMVEGLEND